MKRVNNKFVLIIALILIFHTVSLADTPTTQELLDKYAATQKKIYDSFVIESESESQGYISYTHILEKGKRKGGTASEIRYDGNRFYVSKKKWGNCFPGADTFTPKKDPRYTCRLWDGGLWYFYGNEPEWMLDDLAKKRYEAASEQQQFVKSRHHVTIKDNCDDLNISEPDKNILSCTIYAAGTSAFFDPQLELRLRNSPNITVLPETRKINNANCFVIEAETIDRGKFKIWIDPTHSYNIAKLQNLHKNKSPNGRDYTSKYQITNIRFEKFDDVWVPLELDVSIFNGSKKYDMYQKSKSHYRRTKVILDPNHNMLRSFVPDIPDGWVANIKGIKGFDENTEYTWQNGKLVDKAGRIVNLDLSKKPQ